MFSILTISLENYFKLSNKLVIYKGVQPGQFDNMYYNEYLYLIDEWKDYLDKMEESRQKQEEEARMERSKQMSIQKDMHRNMSSKKFK